MMDEEHWGEWCQITDFDIRTAALRNVLNVEFLASPDVLRRRLTNDLCAGLAYLYIDSLSLAERSKAGGEFWPYQKEVWPQFREFLTHFPRGFEFFAEYFRFSGFKLFEPKENEAEDRRRWEYHFPEMFLDYPESVELRIGYLLGKSILKKYSKVENDRPVSSAYYFSFQPTMFEPYVKQESMMLPDYLSARRLT